MLYSVPCIDLDTTVIHSDRDADDQRTLRKFQPFMEIGIEAHQFGSLVELRYCQSESWSIEFMQGRHIRQVPLISAMGVRASIPAVVMALGLRTVHSS